MIVSHVGNVKDLFTNSAFICKLFKGNHACLIVFFFKKTRFKFCN